jgi:hypothetical protein
MKTVRKLALYCTLTLALGAFAFGPFAFTNVSGLNQVADTSGQPNEWDVGSIGTTLQLADTSGQPNEWDVGSIGTPTLIQLADTSGQPNEWDVG